MRRRTRAPTVVSLLLSAPAWTSWPLRASAIRRTGAPLSATAARMSQTRGSSLECCGDGDAASICVCAGCCNPAAHVETSDGECANVGDPCGVTRAIGEERQLATVLRRLNATVELSWTLAGWDDEKVSEFLSTEGGRPDVAGLLVEASEETGGDPPDGRTLHALMSSYDPGKAGEVGIKSQEEWADLKVRLYAALVRDRLTFGLEDPDEEPCAMFGHKDVCAKYELRKETIGLLWDLYPSPDAIPTVEVRRTCTANEHEELEPFNAFAIHPDQDSPETQFIKGSSNWMLGHGASIGIGALHLARDMYGCGRCAFCRLWKTLRQFHRRMERRFKAVWTTLKAAEPLATKRHVWRTFVEDLAGNDPLLRKAGNGSGASSRFGICGEHASRRGAVGAGVDCSPYYQSLELFSLAELTEERIGVEAEMLRSELDTRSKVLEHYRSQAFEQTKMGVERHLRGVSLWLAQGDHVEVPKRCKDVFDPQNPAQLKRFRDVFEIELTYTTPSIGILRKRLLNPKRKGHILESNFPSVFVALEPREKEYMDCLVAPQKAYEDEAMRCTAAHRGMCMVAAKHSLYTDMVRQAWPPLGALDWWERRKVLAALADAVSASCLREGGVTTSESGTFARLTDEEVQTNLVKQECAFLAQAVQQQLKPGDDERADELTDVAKDTPMVWYLALQRWSQQGDNFEENDAVHVYSRRLGRWFEDGIVTEVDRDWMRMRVTYGLECDPPTTEWFEQGHPDIVRVSAVFSTFAGAPDVDAFTYALCGDILHCPGTQSNASWQAIVDSFNATVDHAEATRIRDLAVQDWLAGRHEQFTWPNQHGVGVLDAFENLDTVFSADIKGHLSRRFTVSELSPYTQSLKDLPASAMLTRHDLDPRALVEPAPRERDAYSSALSLFAPQESDLSLQRGGPEMCPRLSFAPSCTSECALCELRVSAAAGGQHEGLQDVEAVSCAHSFLLDVEGHCRACLRNRTGGAPGRTAYVLNCPDSLGRELYSSLHPVQMQSGGSGVVLHAFFPDLAQPSAPGFPLQHLHLRFPGRDLALERRRDQWFTAVRESGRCWCVCETFREFLSGSCAVAVHPQLASQHPRREECLRTGGKDEAAVRCCAHRHGAVFTVQGCGELRANGEWAEQGLVGGRPSYRHMDDKTIKILWSETDRRWRLVVHFLNLGPFQRRLYESGRNTSTVPLLGWRGVHGRARAPKIQIVDHALRRHPWVSADEACAVKTAAHDHAEFMCSQRGMRLCTREEIASTRDRECPDNDLRRVWTSHMSAPESSMNTVLKSGQFMDAVRRCQAGPEGGSPESGAEGAPHAA